MRWGFAAAAVPEPLCGDAIGPEPASAAYKRPRCTPPPACAGRGSARRCGGKVGVATQQMQPRKVYLRAGCFIRASPCDSLRCPEHVAAPFADTHHGRYDGVLAGAVGEAGPHGVDVRLLEGHAGIGVRRLLERKAKAAD